MDSQGTFAPLLTTTDWSEEWKRLQSARRHFDSVDFWNERASTFHRSDSPNSYVIGFIAGLSLQPGDVIFDMGCGNGALSIPLAQAGYNVIAADFSCKMLEVLNQSAQELGLSGKIKTIEMSWEDDWAQFGMGENTVDVAIASRSIATADLRDSLMRLHTVAKRNVAVSLTTSVSPRVDERILTELGLQAQLGRDLVYAFNILVGEGIHPCISYLRNDRNDRYASREDAKESLARMRDDITKRFPPEQSAEIARKVDQWIEGDLVQDCDSAGTYWRLSKPRRTEWALLSWETDF